MSAVVAVWPIGFANSTEASLYPHSLHFTLSLGSVWVKVPEFCKFKHAESWDKWPWYDWDSLCQTDIWMNVSTQILPANSALKFELACWFMSQHCNRIIFQFRWFKGYQGYQCHRGDVRTSPWSPLLPRSGGVQARSFPARKLGGKASLRVHPLLSWTPQLHR